MKTDASLQVLRWTIAALVAVATYTAATAKAEEKKTFFCSADIVTGLAFNAGKKRWESSTFRPEQKFVLKLRPVRVQGDKDPTQKYLITVSDLGAKSTAMPCVSLDGNGVLVPLNAGAFECTTALANYHVGLAAGRFLQIIPWGYWGGIDNNDNNPAMIAGRCAKAD